MSTTPSEYSTLRPWLLKVAWSMTFPSGIEDLAQEGWVEAWKAEQRYNPAVGTTLIGWIKHCAYQKMLAKSRRTKYKENIVPIGDLDLLDSASWLEATELAYHEGEILKALNELTPRQREYVVLRFWGHYHTTELKEVFGYDPQGLWSNSKNGAKKKLRESLAHLEFRIAD